MAALLSEWFVVLFWPTFVPPLNTDGVGANAPNAPAVLVLVPFDLKPNAEGVLPDIAVANEETSDTAAFVLHNYTCLGSLDSQLLILTTHGK